MTNRDSDELSRFEFRSSRRGAESDLPESLPEELVRKQILHRNVEHVHGVEEIDYELDKLIVLCLVRNGRAYVRSFIEHYFSLGVEHIFFLDNGSTDGTVEALVAFEDVTVLRTELPFKEYQMLMKQYLFERFGQGRWSLYVDIDELFDYPYSDVVNISSLLRYLTQNSYTAVVAHMLDMFPGGAVSDSGSLQWDEEVLKERHRFYDLSNVHTRDFRNTGIVSGTGNLRSNQEIKVFTGGIQQTIFGLAGPLTKHPLVLLDGQVKPMDGSSHAVSNARVADITCVLLHYRFLPHLFEKIRRAVREENYMKDSYKHKIMLKKLDQSRSLEIKRDTSTELGGINDLIQNQFMVVSEDYVGWADVEEKRLARARQGESRKLAETYFRIKAKAQTERVLQLEQQIEELGPSDKGRTVQRVERQVPRIKRQLSEVQNELGKVQNEARLLRERNRELTRQLQGVQASRGWRLLTEIARIRNRVLGQREG